MARPTFRMTLLSPNYWLTWLGFGFWFCLSILPYRMQIMLGRLLGKLLYKLASRRRQIAYANIRMCYPELTEEQCHKRVSEVMESVGIAFFETGMAWFWPRWRLDRRCELKGVEHLEKAKEEGQGVILMALHFTHIDIGAKLLSLRFCIDGSYRPHNNPVYDYVQRSGRERHSVGGQVIPREDVRGMVKALRSGRAIWYAPDQDYGPKNSAFIPFFGIPAATLTATSQLTRLGKARVIPFTQHRKADGKGYRLTIHPPLDGFPSGDEIEDGKRVNQLVEKLINEQPGQYLWVHRRFKTRPEGGEDLYEAFGIRSRKRKK